MITEGTNLPQSEKSEIIKKILRFMVDKEKVTRPEFFHHVQWEICEGGATDNTMKKYLETLHRGGLIVYDHPFWKVTKPGQEWLEKHSI